MVEMSPWLVGRNDMTANDVEQGQSDGIGPVQDSRHDSYKYNNAHDNPAEESNAAEAQQPENRDEQNG